MARYDSNPPANIDGYNSSLDHFTCVAEGLERDLNIDPSDIITASLGFALGWATRRSVTPQPAETLKKIIDELNSLHVKNN